MRLGVLQILLQRGNFTVLQLGGAIQIPGASGAVNFGAPSVSFLWHNVIGAVVVVAVGLLLSLGGSRGAARA